MPTTTYIAIYPVGDLREIGPDDNFRATFTFDILGRAQGVPDNWVRDIAQLIEDDAGSLGTFGTDLFIGRTADIPDAEDVDPVVSLVRNEGLAVKLTHSFESISQLGLMVVVRSIDSETAMARSLGIYKLLMNQRNVTVTR